MSVEMYRPISCVGDMELLAAVLVPVIREELEPAE
jgi:hypothetical protein